MDELSLIQLFCHVNDFVKWFNKTCSQEKIEYKKEKKRNRSYRTSVSEVMTILLLFHQSNYRTFKHFYLRQVKIAWASFFPNLVSYSRFVRLISETFFPMFCFFKEHQGVCQGIGFLDSTVLSSCHIRRASSHRTFKGMAKWGKTSTGYFFGFKLHLIINHHAEIVAFRLTSGNIDDRVPVPKMTKNIKGKMFADRGYISQKLQKVLKESGLLLITKIKKKMKNKLMHLWDKLMLRKRGIIESVNNLLKSDCQIEHHRHRSKCNFYATCFQG